MSILQRIYIYIYIYIYIQLVSVQFFFLLDTVLDYAERYYFCRISFYVITWLLNSY